jgi:hypothetical protein
LHDEVERIQVQGMSGTLTIVVDKSATGVQVITESGGPFVEYPDDDFLFISPAGYRRAPKAAGIHVGGNLTISSSGGGIAAGVINGPVRLGELGGPEIGSPSYGPVAGSIKLIVGSNVKSVTLEDCHGHRIGPDGESHDMTGSRERISLV